MHLHAQGVLTHPQNPIILRPWILKYPNFWGVVPRGFRCGGPDPRDPRRRRPCHKNDYIWYKVGIPGPMATNIPIPTGILSIQVPTLYTYVRAFLSLMRILALLGIAYHSQGWSRVYLHLSFECPYEIAASSINRPSFLSTFLIFKSGILF